MLARTVNIAGQSLMAGDVVHFSNRFPPVVAADVALLAHSCLIDGEVTVTDEAGLAIFACSGPGVTTTMPCCAPSI
jgi:hypothetical protein